MVELAISSAFLSARKSCRGTVELYVQSRYRANTLNYTVNSILEYKEIKSLAVLVRLFV